MDYEDIQIKQEPDFIDSVVVKTEYEITEQEEEPLSNNQNKYDGYIKEEIKEENSENVVQFEITEISGISANFEHSDSVLYPKRSVPEHSFENTEMFYCAYCWETFKCKFTLTEHLMYHLYLMQNSLACKICYKKFKTKNHLSQHMKSFHIKNKVLSTSKPKGRPRKVSGKEPLRCPYCERTVFKIRTLENHMSTDHYGLPFDARTRPFTCTVCGQDYDFLNDLKKHVRKHTVKESYQCGFCKLTLLTVKEIRDHVAIHHQECELPKKFPYVWKLVTCPYTGKTVPAREYVSFKKRDSCIFCGDVFLEPTTLETHMFTEHPDFSVNETTGYFSCTICGQEYKALYDLEKHVVVHSTKETYQCEVCKLTLLTKAEMDDHITINHKQSPEITDLRRIGRIKTGPQPKSNKCAYCDRAFVRICTLKNHISAVHFGLPLQTNSDGSYTCTVCGQSYQNLDNLKKHVRGHNVKESYQCGFCNQIVLTEREIHNHVQTFHHRSELPATFPLEWKLITCPHTGKTIPAMPSRKFHKCPICPRLFSDMESVEAHLQKHKKSYLKYECTMCGMGFPEQDSISLNHIKRHESVDPLKRVEVKRVDHTQMGTEKTDSSLSTWMSTSFLEENPSENHEKQSDLNDKNKRNESSVNSLFQLLKKAKDSQTDTKSTESSSSTSTTVKLSEEKPSENLVKNQIQIDKSVNSLFHLLKKAQDAKKIIRNRKASKSSSASKP